MIKGNKAYLAAYKKAVHKYGTEAQLIKCVEELAELQKELCMLCNCHGDIENVKDELADVLIMVDQVVHIIGIDKKKLKEHMDYKIERLKQRLIVKTH